MPSLPATAYLRPDTLDDALALLDEGGVAVAGGTAVILHPPATIATLVDVSEALAASITENDGAVRIGAMATLTAMIEHPALATAYDGELARMLRMVGSPLLRNAATIGGHLGRGRLSDVIPLLIALDASVTYSDGEAHTVALDAYYGAAAPQNRHLITEVSIPPRPLRSAAAFRKLARTHFDLAMLNGAARIALGEDGVVTEARVVVGETPALGARVPEAERVLVGAPPTDEAIAAAAAAARDGVPVGSDGRASAEYRTQLAGVVVSRCLTQARTFLEEPG
jgi:carbon-monoxide dehydrogenase medium subunit